MDKVVSPVITAIVNSGKIPLVIGGGHNNAYPILKGCSEALGETLNCINLDAHSDFRRIEGRHSGNGFRYAKTEGYLGRYALPWLHEAYNSATIVEELKCNADIFLQFAEAGSNLSGAIDEAIRFTNGSPTGIELDLDCIAGVLSSAATPSGISAEQAREFLQRCARECHCVYLHLTEGATELRDGRNDPLTAKLISYLLRDFIAARKACGSLQ
jgi:formiminoglutamase